MKQKKFEQNNETQSRPIVLPKETMDRILKADKPHIVLSVYLFYYYTSIWQETNQPKATTDYVAKGLGITERKVRRAKKYLEQIGLIQNITTRNNNGKINGHFIKLYYKTSFATLAVLHTVAKCQTNAYSTNNKMLVEGDKSPVNREQNRESFGFLKNKNLNEFEKRCSIKLQNAVISKRKLFRKVNIKQWIKSFKELQREGISQEKIKSVLNWYISNIGKEFVPLAYSAKAFQQKFLQIEDAMNRTNTKTKVVKITDKITYNLICKHVPLVSQSVSFQNMFNTSWENAKELYGKINKSKKIWAAALKESAGVFSAYLLLREFYKYLVECYGVNLENPKTVIFSIDNKHVQSFGELLMVKYFAVKGRWNEMIGQLYEN